MLPSSSAAWISTALEHIDDKFWLKQNLDNAFYYLPDHLSNPLDMLAGTAVLDAIVEICLDAGIYTPLKRLLALASDNFNNLTPPTENFPTVSIYNTFVEQNPREYFRIRLNLAHVYLMLREVRDARELLYELVDILHTVDGINQLEAYCLILKFFGYGNYMELDFDIVYEATELAVNRYPQCRLNLYIAIAYFHFAQSDLDEMKNMLDKIMRLMADEIQLTSIDMIDVNRISAEQNYFLAVIYRDLKQFDEATKHLDRASEQYSRLENPIRNMLMLYERAVLFRFRGETDAAQQWLKLAYDEYYGLAEPQEFHLAMLDHTKGLICIDLGDFETAYHQFEKVLVVWRKADHIYHTALTYNAIGYCLYEMGKIDDAIQNYVIAKEKCGLMDELHAESLMSIIDENIENAENRLMDS
jgi:tetratricopeptide (TPR) repeat protein